MIPKPKEQSGVELIVCTRCKRTLADDSRFCAYCGKELFPKRAKARRPNGAGSVTKLSGKRARPWRARITKGTVTYEVCTFATSAAAMNAIATFSPPSASSVRAAMTLSDVYAIVLDGKTGNVSRSSIETYRAAWKHLSTLADAPITDLKAADYQRIID